MAEPQNFRVDSSDYLSFNYKAYCYNLRGIALTQPRELVRMRRAVTARLRDELVRSWFDSIYNALTTGRIGDALIDPAFAPNRLGAPSYPKQNSADIAMAGAQKIEAIMNEVLEILLAADYEKLAVHRQHQRAAAAGI